MIRKCIMCLTECYDSYEKKTEVRFFIEGEELKEKIKLLLESYKVLKRMCNLNFVGILFNKAIVYDANLNVVFTMNSEDYEKYEVESHGG